VPGVPLFGFFVSACRFGFFVMMNEIKKLIDACSLWFSAHLINDLKFRIFLLFKEIIGMTAEIRSDNCWTFKNKDHNSIFATDHMPIQERWHYKDYFLFIAERSFNP
jgi:hypothetical protein